ncbi:sensor domain-containing diguanylate cyclase [Euzebya tangerina]|uniref:GGDEF domain-containing protein n=1 Tax=Euzebya tangerina TaxID=591198 RepID=UPI000E31D6FF|nr:GGDEF domain-containing protein [Euzebya tangerina]
MPDSSALLSGRLTKRSMAWLIVAVMAVSPSEFLSDGVGPFKLTLLPRLVFLAALLAGLLTDRITPIRAGRAFLALGVITCLGWSIGSTVDPGRAGVETVGYGTIMPLLTMLVAPRTTRRRWSVAVAALMLGTGSFRLLPDAPITLMQSFAIIATHAAALLTLDAHTDRAEEAGQLADLDPLTGLENRRPMVRRLTTVTAAIDDTGPGATVLMIDLDHFKALNDTRGHAAGDATLVEIAEILAHAIRPGDAVCRWGGEEFLVLLGRADLDAARHTAERIRAAISRTDVTASIGAAQGVPGELVEQWIARADAALYTAKQDGRDRVVLASDDCRDAAEDILGEVVHRSS